MAFDIHQPLFDEESGEYFEQAAFQYRKELEALFEASVEGNMLSDEGIEPGWVDITMELGIGYLQVGPAQMTAEDLRTILFDLIPRKITADASQVPEVIRELHLFWTFLRREFHVEHAAACLNVLNEKETVVRMRKAMENPANFGMAKSLMTMGAQRGFDMTSEAGINEWIATYNAELGAGTGTPVPFPAISALPTQRETPRRKAAPDSARRKMAKKSRKQNRTKK